MIDQADTFAFVGRSADAATPLVDAWKDVVAGGRRVVSDRGRARHRQDASSSRRSAGIAHDHGGLVLWGGCDEDLGIPYQPFAEALR